MNWIGGFSSAVLALALVVAANSPASAADVTTQTEVTSGSKPCAIESLARPYVLLNAKRVAELRDEVATTGPRRTQYLREIRDYADNWLQREIVVPERAGHFHHFTCDDGTRLKVPGDYTFENNEYKCPACGRVYTGEKYDGARRNYEHGWLIRAARSCAIAWALEQKPEYAARAAEILRKYADAYPAVGRHTGPTTGGIFYQSLDESMHMILLAQAYDLVHDSGALSAADMERIDRDLFWEAAEGIRNMGTGGNWGSWHLSAVGVIGLATKHQRFIDFGIDNFKSQIVNQLGADGLWPESVHTYHFFPLMAFVDLAEAATNAGTPLWDFEGRDGRGLRAMFTAPVQYMYPNLQLPAINDGWFKSYMPADLYSAAYYRYRLPEFAWVLAETKRRTSGERYDPNSSRTNWPFLLGLELPADIQRPKLESTNFPVLGIAVLRDTGGDMTVTFDYGPHLGHGQLDKMGVTLFANGRLLAADYGTPSYGSSILPYYTGTASHNTVMIDGQNQQRTKAGRLNTWAPLPLVAGPWQAAAATTAEAYPGTSWTREVWLMPPLLTIADSLESTAPRRYDWLFHCEGDDLRIEGATAADSAARGADIPHFTGMKWWKPAGDPVTASWREKGRELLSARVEPQAGMLFGAGRCPAESGTRTVPVLVIRQHGLRADYRVTLSLPPESEAKP
jgi:hypothetical protein